MGCWPLCQKQVTSLNANWFLKCFYYQTQQEVCNVIIDGWKVHHTLRCVNITHLISSHLIWTELDRVCSPFQMRWDEMRWDRIGLDQIGSDGIGSDGMRWDEMRCDECLHCVAFAVYITSAVHVTFLLPFYSVLDFSPSTCSGTHPFHIDRSSAISP